MDLTQPISKIRNDSSNPTDYRFQNRFEHRKNSNLSRSSSDLNKSKSKYNSGQGFHKIKDFFFFYEQIEILKRLVRSASNVDRGNRNHQNYVRSPLGQIPEKDYPMIPRAKSASSLVSSFAQNERLRQPPEPKKLWTKVAYRKRHIF